MMRAAWSMPAYCTSSANDEGRPLTLPAGEGEPELGGGEGEVGFAAFQRGGCVFAARKYPGSSAALRMTQKQEDVGTANRLKMTQPLTSLWDSITFWSAVREP